MVNKRNQIVYGVFKGMGDLLWAAPVIRAELDAGAAVHLLLFPGKTILEFCSLIDFGQHRDALHLHSIPRSRAEAGRFLAEMRYLRPQLIWISPHAPVADSSWKVPLGLFLLKLFFWHHAELVGASSECLSKLFSHSIPINRELPLREREWAAYRQLCVTSLPDQPPLPQFLSEIMQRREQPPEYDLVIHPGASAANRVWPADKYPAVIAALPPHWKIAVVGLSADVEKLKSEIDPTLSEGRKVDYLSGSLYQSLIRLASARQLLVMDSGNVHFAEVLGVPSVAVFGQQKPDHVIGDSRFVQSLYQQTVSCQPCGRGTCSQPQVYCLVNLKPGEVAQLLEGRLSTPA